MESPFRTFMYAAFCAFFPRSTCIWPCSFLAASLTHHPAAAWVWKDYLASFFYVGNYRFVVCRRASQFIGHAWALSLEEQFYLIWPWVFAAFQDDLRKLTRLLIAAIVLVDVYRIILFFGLHASDRWLTYTFDSRVDHVLVGCLLAILLKRRVVMRFWNFLTARTLISIIPLALIVLSIGLAFRYHLAYKYAVGFVVDPILTAILLVQVIAMGNTWMWSWLNWKPTRHLGRISYAMFLYHLLVARILISFLGQHSLWVMVPAVVFLLAVIGTLSYYLVEMRFLRLKSRFKRPSTRPIPTPAPSLQPVSS